MHTCAPLAPRANAPATAEPNAPLERHYAAAEVAGLWHLNVETVRRLFEHEPGVVVLQAARAGKRPYRTLRIPQSVLDRVHKRLQVGGHRG